MGKAQYSSPPCTNLFRSTSFDSADIIYSFIKQATLIRRLTGLSLSLQLLFPALYNGNIICHCSKTSYLNEEVNCTEPSLFG
jgi:hypothetical protein